MARPPLFDAEPRPAVAQENCNNCSLCYQACPGKDIPLPELDTFLFGRTRHPENEPLGIYREVYEGYARDLSLRRKGASGGSVTGLLIFALEHNIIDGVLVATTDLSRPWRNVPIIATTKEELVRAMTTRHCLVPTNMLLSEAVLKRGIKKLGIVGCPCHIEAVRKIQMHGKPRKLAKAITLTVGLFCATNFWWEATRHIMAEECGIDKLDELKDFIYRGGDRPQHFIADLVDGTTKQTPLFASFLNYLFPFQTERCSTCYDWGAELADISFGDLYVSLFLRPNEPGWNSIIARTETGENLLLAAKKADYLFVRKSVVDYTMACYGIECKKHGGSYSRLWRQKHGWVIPDFGYRPTVPEPWPESFRNANLKVDDSYFDKSS